MAAARLFECERGGWAGLGMGKGEGRERGGLAGVGKMGGGRRDLEVTRARDNFRSGAHNMLPFVKCRSAGVRPPR